MQTYPSSCIYSDDDLGNFPTYQKDTFQNYHPRESPSSTRRSFVIYLAVQDSEPIYHTVVNDDSGLVLREISKETCSRTRKRDRPDSHKWSRGDKKTREQEG